MPTCSPLSLLYSPFSLGRGFPSNPSRAFCSEFSFNRAFRQPLRFFLGSSAASFSLATAALCVCCTVKRCRDHSLKIKPVILDFAPVTLPEEPGVLFSGPQAWRSENATAGMVEVLPQFLVTYGVLVDTARIGTGRRSAKMFFRFVAWRMALGPRWCWLPRLLSTQRVSPFWQMQSLKLPIASGSPIMQGMNKVLPE